MYPCMHNWAEDMKTREQPIHSRMQVGILNSLLTAQVGLEGLWQAVYLTSLQPQGCTASSTFGTRPGEAKAEPDLCAPCRLGRSYSIVCAGQMEEGASLSWYLSHQLSAAALSAPPSQVCQATGTLPQALQTRGKKISKAVSSVRWGKMSVLCGCLLQSDGPPSSSRSEHSSQNSGIYNLSHRQHFYSTKACYIISTYKFTCFHKVKIHTYNPTTRSCIKTLLAPQQGIAQTWQRMLSYLKSSLISLTVAWNGMFRTRILEVFCFLTVCFFREDFTAGLSGEQTGQVRGTTEQHTQGMLFAWIRINQPSELAS